MDARAVIFRLIRNGTGAFSFPPVHMTGYMLEIANRIRRQVEEPDRFIRFAFFLRVEMERSREHGLKTAVLHPWTLA